MYDKKSLHLVNNFSKKQKMIILWKKSEIMCLFKKKKKSRVHLTSEKLVEVLSPFLVKHWFRYHTSLITYTTILV